MKKIPLFDRDLSWLSFNYRVLLEAKDPEIPPLERLRFIAIYSSNLDEFFRVRVASLRRLIAVGKKKINKKLDLNPESVLSSIHQNVDEQLKEYGKTLQQVLNLLKKNGVIIHQHDPIPSRHREELSRYFTNRILAFMQPKLLRKKEVPFLRNRALYFALQLEKKGKTYEAVLNIPSDRLPRFYPITEGDKIYYYFIEDIIRQSLDWIFPGYGVMECHSFKLNKDADLQIDDEFSGDLVAKIEKQVKKRDLGEPSRFLYDQNFSKELLNVFTDLYDLDEEDLVSGGSYHNLNDFFQIRSPKKSLEFPSRPVIRNRSIDQHASVFEAIDSEDQILHFPYQSYDYILQFFNEAAIDPQVTEIDVTFYRMAEDSVIGEALISASQNGKQVNVFMEVKARFDEENNLRWARRMTEAGIHIRYSLPGLKVHAKVALVRKETGKKVRFYGFFGTGNLNESTAKIYCDHGLLTSRDDLTQELNQVFQFLQHQKEPKPFKELIVSQFGALERFGALIDQEIAQAKAGKKARLLIKVNNLEEPNLIQKLYEAAKAGVEVKVLARSICCMVPGTAGIEVSRIVDRYLEHARIFYFYSEGEEEVFMGSSDWMNRNLHRRVEVTFPVHERHIKEQILQILNLQFQDNSNRVLLGKSIENLPVKPQGKANAQADTYAYIKSLQTDQ
jgi:polyphosphate kinase